MTVKPRRVLWRLRSGERRALLVIGDLVAAIIATFVALTLWAQLDYLGPEPTPEFIRARAPWFVLLPFIWLALMVNLYDVHRASSRRDTIRGIFLASAFGGVLYLVLFFTTDGSLPRLAVLYFLLLAAGLTLLWRLIYIAVFTAPAFMRRVLVAGAGDSSRYLLDSINGVWPPPFHLVGLVDDDTRKQGKHIQMTKVLGGSSDLLEIVEEQHVSDIIVAVRGEMQGEMFQALLDAQERGVEISRMPTSYEELFGRVPIRYLESDWLLSSFVDEVRVSTLYLVIKRAIDVAGALAGLLILLLVLPLAAIAILIETGRPVFYTQERLGQGAKRYYVIKLRTMQKDAEPEGRALVAQKDDPRTTKVGRFLRRTYLDELPQFWSVLRGDMSLVGPRPERPELIAEYEEQIPFYRARLLAKPGITGWAQVNYGKGASVEGTAEKLEYDLYYIKHRGAGLDLWITLRTIGHVIGFRGV
jgi:exopolysaccharide biosynthesis polyprenyl glycosylphosphotransferase